MRTDEASEAARALANTRWSPEKRLDTAVRTVISRSGELTGEQLAGLRAIAEDSRQPGGEQ
jgi:hypothetical protein